MDLKRARELTEEWKLQEAYQEVERMLLGGGNNEEEKLQGEMLKIELLDKMGYYENGLQLAKKVYEEAQKLNNPLLTIDNIISIAKAYNRLTNLSKSLEMVEKGEQFLSTNEIIPEEESEKRRAILLSLKGRIIFYKSSDVARSLEYYEKSLEITERIGYKNILPNVLNGIGNYYFQIDNYKKALEYFQKALIKAKEINDKLEIIDSLSYIGYITGEMGDKETSLEYLGIAKKKIDKVGNKRDLAHNYGEFSLFYYIHGDVEKALHYRQKSLALMKEINDKYWIIICQISLIDILIARKELDLVKKQLKECSTNIENLKDQHQKAMMYNLVAQRWDEIGELKRALECYDKSCNLYHKLEEKILYDGIFNNRTRVLVAMGDLDQALEVFQNTLNNKNLMKVKRFQARTLLDIGNIYHIRAEFQTAEDYYERAWEKAGETESAIFWMTTRILLDLIIVLIEQGKIQKANDYLGQLSKYKEKYDNADTNQAFSLAKGLILKESKRLADKTKAQEIFRQLGKEETGNYKIKNLASISYLDLLIFELKTINITYILMRKVL